MKQYESIAKIAVIRSLLTDSVVPLHLTLVGQGVFNNPPAIIERALNRVAAITASYNVQVYVHVFGASNKKKVLDSLHKPQFQIKTMSRLDFKTLK